MTLVAVASPPARAGADSQVDREVTRTFLVKGEVSYRNLAGRVTVHPTSGREVTIKAVVHAGAGNADEARKLLDALRVDFRPESGDLVVEAVYPLDRHRHFRYPVPGQDGSGWQRGTSTTKSTYDGKAVTVTTGDDSRAVTLWVDLDVGLPPGIGLRVSELAGAADISGVEGPLKIENGWGDIRVSEGNGSAWLETGSGDVTVRARRGDLRVETGSGDVVVDAAEGGVWVETGSGDVRLTAVKGSRIVVETGSGDARIAGSRGDEVSVETGSGTIVIESPDFFKRPIAAAARFETGSGDVILLVDDEVSMVLDFSSGSGRVRSPRSLADRIERVGRGRDRRYRIGEGESRVSVGTGSGDMVFRLVGR